MLEWKANREVHPLTSSDSRYPLFDHDARDEQWLRVERFIVAYFVERVVLGIDESASSY